LILSGTGHAAMIVIPCYNNIIYTKIKREPKLPLYYM